jgi:hypothetical protein
MHSRDSRQNLCRRSQWMAAFFFGGYLVGRFEGEALPLLSFMEAREASDL